MGDRTERDIGEGNALCALDQQDEYAGEGSYGAIAAYLVNTVDTARAHRLVPEAAVQVFLDTIKDEMFLDTIKDEKREEKHGAFGYRCTREAPYVGKNVPGAKDTSARQGYYITANSAGEAYREMCDRYPNEAEIGFTIEPWMKG